RPRGSDKATPAMADVDVKGSAGPTPLLAWSAEARISFALAVPLVLTQVGQVAMFTTDLMLIGRLGDTYLAAGALAHTILFSAFIFGMGIMSAVAPLTAQAVGARDAVMIRRSLRVGIHAAIAIGFPFVGLQLAAEPILLAIGQAPETSALAGTYLYGLAWSVVPAWIFFAMRGYMSALDRPQPGMWIMLAAIPLNVALAYLLIYGGLGLPALGIIGAGIATTIVNVLMCIAAAAAIRADRHLNQYEPLVRLWRPDWEQFRSLFVIGTPIGAAFFMEHGLFAIAVLFAGLISTAALASHQIAMQMASLAFMVPLGIGQAAAVRVGYWYGARNPVAAQQAGWVGLTLTAVSTTIVMIAAWATAGHIPELFLGAETPDNADTFRLAPTLVIIAACFFVIDGLQCVTCGILRGYNDTRPLFFYSTFSFWVVGVPVLWLLAFTFGFGAPGLWVGLTLALLVYAALLIRRFRHTSARHIGTVS
ncbi:MAG: MATE family efflux transporter, partial [Pseudomonadota bacterium]